MINVILDKYSIKTFGKNMRYYRSKIVLGKALGRSEDNPMYFYHVARQDFNDVT